MAPCCGWSILLPHGCYPEHVLERKEREAWLLVVLRPS